VGKPEGKKPLGRQRFRWMDNIKMYLRDIGWDGMVWYGLNRSGSGQGSVEGNKPSGSIK
jgi:hypothetical protein